MRDLSAYFRHEITVDSDGRSPEDVFYDWRALANNRMPFCSRLLKAERLQKYYRHQDILIFGIGPKEPERAQRLVSAYQRVAAETGRWPRLLFPLIDHQVSDADLNAFLRQAKIEEPYLYKLGFSHNSCSGGCVRAGKKQWKLLLETLPEVYAAREKVEEEVRAYLGKDVHILKDETLREFRERVERGDLSKHYDNDDPSENPGECVGGCLTTA